MKVSLSFNWIPNPNREATTTTKKAAFSKTEPNHWNSQVNDWNPFESGIHRFRLLRPPRLLHRRHDARERLLLALGRLGHGGRKPGIVQMHISTNSVSIPLPSPLLSSQFIPESPFFRNKKPWHYIYWQQIDDGDLWPATGSGGAKRRRNERSETDRGAVVATQPCRVGNRTEGGLGSGGGAVGVYRRYPVADTRGQERSHRNGKRGEPGKWRGLVRI